VDFREEMHFSRNIPRRLARVVAKLATSNDGIAFWSPIIARELAVSVVPLPATDLPSRLNLSKGYISTLLPTIDPRTDDAKIFC